MSIGIPARSVANVRCGGTTRVSNLLHGLFLFMLVKMDRARWRTFRWRRWRASPRGWDFVCWM